MSSRTGRSVLAALVLLVALRVGVAPAEHCPEVSSAQARRSIEQAVEWLGRTQHRDGRFRYLSDDEGHESGGYNVVRHAGVLLSLEQAVNAGVPAAEPVADAGWEWALDRVRSIGPGRALTEVDGRVETGATALLIRALVERGTVDEDLLHDLGAFLAGQVHEDGSVASAYDLTADRPTGDPSPFYTGEAFWALLGVPDQQAAAERIGAHLPERDDLEPGWLPVSDHWAAYGYGDLGADALSDAQLEHAHLLAELFSIQVRSESTRWEGGLQGLIRRGPALGSAVGTLGEGAGALLRLGDEHVPPGLAERLRCTAGMLVERQDDDGAWYTHGLTRMDDQQHAISALIAAEGILDDGEAVGGGEEPWGIPLLLAAGLLFANPFLPVERSRRALLGAGAVGVVLVVLSGPVLDLLSTSPANARMAAGAGALVAGLGWLVSPRAAVSAGLGAAAAGVAAVSAGADSGAVATLAVAVGVLSVVLAPATWRRAWAARLAAVALLAVGLDLLARGTLGV